MVNCDGIVKSIKNCHSEQPVPTRREGTSEESQPIIDEILRRFASLRMIRTIYFLRNHQP
ncbi:MAG: hypothetical protein J7L86_02040 [Candidatus Marinimicrobia bacterium]|nr:hypothetical protein [Candidatus Neomarinimicrobiota bacterium]